MRHAGPTRREIGVRTAFNLLGPLTNPAGTTPPAARGRRCRRRRRGWPRCCGAWARSGRFVVHGDGVDELPLDGSGVLYDVTPTRRSSGTRSMPRRSGFERAADRAAGRRHAGRERRDRRGGPRAASRARAATSSCSTPARRCSSPGVVGAAARRGSSARPLTIDAGLATELLERLRARAPTPPKRRPRRGDAGMTTRSRRRRRGAARHAPRRRRRTSSTRSPPRRRADIRAELDGVDATAASRAPSAAAPAPRPIAERLAAPGLHLIAEIKRTLAVGRARSPRGDDDIVARARAYEAGGAAAISVLCEPHWFGGSVDDLGRVRAAVAIPVLAKEFVVDARPAAACSARPAPTSSCCSRSSTRRKRLAPARRPGAASSGWSRSSRPTTSASSSAALATDARLIGLNNRDLRTLDGRHRAGRPPARRSSPTTGSSSPNPACATPATVARLARPRVRRRARRRGADARRRSGGRGAARSSPPARRPDDPANVARRPFVKICGVTDAEGVLAAVRAGADAIGLNLVPGTPRALDARRGGRAGRVVRAARGPPVAPPADRGDHRRRRPRTCSPGSSPRSTRTRPAQRRRVRSPAAARGRATGLEGAPRPGRRARRRRRRRRSRRPSSRAAVRTSPPASSASSSTPPAGRTPAAPGTRADAALAAAVAREMPVVLAGGLEPGERRRRRSATIPAVGVDVASGVGGAHAIAGRSGPRKDPLRVALFVKRAARRPRRPPEPPVRPDAGPRRPARRRRAPAAGGWSATSAAATSRRRSWPRSSSSRRPTTRSARTRASGPSCASCSARSPAARPPSTAPTGWPTRSGSRRAGSPAATRPRAALPRRLRLYLKREDLAHTGRPQDQQRPRPGAAHPPPRQDPGHRRDRRRPARRRDRHGLRPARPAVRRLHGRRGHRAPGAERAPDARARRRGPAGHVRARRRSRTPSTRRCATG